MIYILAVFLSEIMLKSRFHFYMVYTPCQGTSVDNLEMVHLLIRHLHIPAGGIMQFGIDSSRLQSVGIGKEATLGRVVAEIENRPEIFGSISAIDVEVLFFSGGIPSLSPMKSNRIIVNVHRIRRNPIITVTLIAHPSAVDPPACSALQIGRHAVKAVVRFADEV